MARTRRALTIIALSVWPLLNPCFAHADVVLDWNIVALKTAASAPFNPPLESRNLAIAHSAMFDAVNSIVREFHPYAVRLNAPQGASPDAAAVAAAHLALVQLYPDHRMMLDAAYTGSLALIPDGPNKAAGIILGEAVASRILAVRASDGGAAAITAPYTPGAGAGFWTPTPPAFLRALDPGWGSVHPFLLEDESQFRPGPPPALNSRRYTRDFDEIKEVGSITSTTRTQEQTDLARFWIATGPQNWNPAARQAAVAQGLTLSQNARVFALLNLAGADAFIAAWDAKFTYNQWRPVTAIRAADSDGNPDTLEDPSWTPLLVTPPFPDYIAGHTMYAGAAQKVLEHVFGKRPGVVLTLGSASAPGVVETYTTFRAIADGVVDARVWGGIHWRTSSARGRAVGEEIGRYATHHFLRPMKGRGRRALR
jgi:hypothetical protein